MLVSEQASEKDGLADFSTGASTFPGSRMRGGWIPVFLKPAEGRPIISDWICPACKCLTGNYRTCPKCGLEVLTRPHIKAPLQKGARVDQYRKWSYTLFEDDDENDKSRRESEGFVRPKFSSSSRRSRRRRGI